MSWQVKSSATKTITLRTAASNTSLVTLELALSRLSTITNQPLHTLVIYQVCKNMNKMLLLIRYLAGDYTVCVRRERNKCVIGWTPPKYSLDKYG